MKSLVTFSSIAFVILGLFSLMSCSDNILNDVKTNKPVITESKSNIHKSLLKIRKSLELIAQDVNYHQVIKDYGDFNDIQPTELSPSFILPIDDTADYDIQINTAVNNEPPYQFGELITLLIVTFHANKPRLSDLEVVFGPHLPAPYVGNPYKFNAKAISAHAKFTIGAITIKHENNPEIDAMVMEYPR